LSIQQADSRTDDPPLQPGEIFVCPEETIFYSTCIRHILFQPWIPGNIVEFGSGDGSPVLQALGSSSFAGFIQGYEINTKAAALARKNIASAGKADIYQVQNSCFFKAFRKHDPQLCLTSNPPYVPALEPDRLLMPQLWGGPDGSRILRSLLDQDLDYALLLMPSISNPERIIAHAWRQGYRVHNYLITALPFGRYTAQAYVQDRLNQMHKQRQAFFYAGHYLLAGVLFCKSPSYIRNQEDTLLRLLTSEIKP
jgi:methylase of polypeptide subunit release factors